MYSVKFLRDLVQIQERETVSAVFLARMNIPIQVWHVVEVMQRDFNEHHMTQVTITKNQLGTMQRLEEVSEHVGMNYLPDTPGSRYMAQPVDDFHFPWQKGSVENPFIIEEMRDFLSQELQSANHQDNYQRQRQISFALH